MNLDFELELLFASRKRLLSILDELTEDKLLTIPPGFNNNALWLIGHCVVSQQRLVYLRSNLPMNVSDQYNENFKIGTSPKIWTIPPDRAEIRNSLLTTAEQLKEDLNNGIFKTYEQFKPSMGFLLKNHMDAITYANYHEVNIPAT